MAFIGSIVNHIKAAHFPDRVKKEITIVDVGCGNGDQVYQLITEGFNAYGCDLRFKKGEHVTVLSEGEYLRKIDDQYRLPFDNEFADIVFTNQVVEHVQDLESFFSEIKRVTKKGGIGIHCYPNINLFFEPHVKIPLATRIQSHKWVDLWKRQPIFNIPNKHWSDKSSDEITDYLQNKTCFRTNKQIKNIALQYFESVWFDGDLLLKAIAYKKKGKLFSLLPGGGALFNAIWTSLLFTKKL